MGILSALKKVVGKSAEVDITVENAKRGGKAKVTVDVHVGSDAVKAKRVYVQLRCNEVVDIPRYHVSSEMGVQGSSSRNIRVQASEAVFEKEFVIAEGPDLPAGATSQFTAEIDIPAGALPSMTGQTIRVQWHALAALDVAWATDPSSGWQEIGVS